MAGLSGKGCLDAHLNLVLLKLTMDVGAFTHCVKTQRDGNNTPAPSFAAFEQTAMLAQGVGTKCARWPRDTR